MLVRQGMGSTLIQAMPFTASYFAFSEAVSRYYVQYRERKNLSASMGLGAMMGCGAASAVGAVIVSTFVESVRLAYHHGKQLTNKEHVSLKSLSQHVLDEGLSMAPRSAIKRATYGFVKNSVPHLPALNVVPGGVSLPLTSGAGSCCQLP